MVYRTPTEVSTALEYTWKVVGFAVPNESLASLLV